MSGELLRLWPRAERILDEVFDLDDPEREERALAACGTDEELASVVRALLEADRRCGGFLAVPPVTPGTAGPEPSASGAGTLPARIGAFRVVRELGRGGMGAVVLADRVDGQFEQRVAIKLLPGGSYSAASRQALLREREILGRLDHPHIARLYDGGLTEDAVPYFVMEFVDGSPLDAHADANRLSVEDRLALFAQVCSAVEYAHGRLVVHRDLKPGNVLVDGEGRVKLLDFGIAKVMEEAGDATQTVHRMLTPAYAAPEQVRGDPVTTATDVYQLGLLLYELLTGHRAHGDAAASGVDLERVTERDPPRPSRAAREGRQDPRRDGAPALTAEEIAARRRTTPAALARRLDGDLDAIVLVALRKEPERRYPTVEALRRDLESFLASRPVSARRGTAGYKLGKYARRHKAQAAAVAAVGVSLAAGVVGVMVEARIAARERDRARSAEATATAVNEFLVDELLRAPAPENSLGRVLTVADVLGNASRSVGHALAGHPETEAEVRRALAQTYAALGKPAEARGHAETAHRLLAGARGAQSPETLRARRLLADLDIEAGRYAEARAQLAELRGVQSEILGPRHPDTLETAATLGRAAHAAGDWASAETLLRDTLAVVEAEHPDRWRLGLQLRTHLTDTLIAQEKPVEAEAVSRRALEIQTGRLGPEHPDRAPTLQRLSLALYKQLRHREAAAAYEELVAVEDRLYGKDHPQTADALIALATVYFNGLHRKDEAAAANERALGIYRASFGPDHPKTLRALENLGVIHSRAERHEAAEAIYREVRDTRRRLLGPTHPDTIRSLTFLNQLLFRAGKLPEAREAALDVRRAYEQAIAVPSADVGVLSAYAEFLTTADPEEVRDARRALSVAELGVTSSRRTRFYPLREMGRAQALLGRHTEAIATLREAMALSESLRSWTTEELLADLLAEHGAPGEVEGFLNGRVAALKAQRGDSEPLAARSLRLLALHHERRGRRDEAERAFAESLSQLRKTHKDSEWPVGRAKSELAQVLLARGAHAEAERLLLEADEALRAAGPDRKVLVDANRARLVKLYESWKRRPLIPSPARAGAAPSVP